MSKLSFRARALDAAKPLPVYRDSELPDRTDCVSINRSVPQMPTGMEKEEELEHHLQRAISAQQVFREKKENMVIPVPEAESNTTYYDRLYKGEVKVPKQLIHIQPLGLDLEQPDYDMDSEDETLINRLNRKMEIKPLQFETMVDRLEKATTHQPVSLTEAKLLLNEDDFLLKAVYDYWLRKRKSCAAPSLVPHIKLEKRDGSSNNDAYVAFRRRTEKMQTRKNRKNDEASYEKMLRLRREFSRTVTILEMIKRREKSKREMLHLTLEVVERRFQIEDFSGDLLRQVSVPLLEKPVYSSRYRTDIKKTTSIRDDLPFSLTKSRKRRDRPSPHQRLSPLQRPSPPQRLSPLQRPSPQRRPCQPTFTVNKANIRQYDFTSSGDDSSTTPPPSPPSSTDEENNPDGVFVFRRKAGCQYLSPGTEQVGGAEPPGLRPLRHSLAELSLPPHWTGLSRRRIGRGGRIILDRVSSGLDPLLKQLDCRTRTRTNEVLRPTAQSLTEVLNNIQTLRRFCFRPRPRQDQRETRTTESSLEDRRLTDRHSVLTEQQFLSHQQQLMLMQKQQLEQHRAGRTTPQQDPHTQTSRSGESGSQTLDSASARFAASAVISSSRPHLNPNRENRPTSSLKLATSAASADRVPKVSTARDPHEERLNGLTETTLPMEVT